MDPMGYKVQETLHFRYLKFLVIMGLVALADHQELHLVLES